MIGLKEKVAIITGCAGGIGEAVAIRFAQEGTKLVLVDFNEKLGNETLAKVHTYNKEAIFVQADVSKEDDVNNFVQRALDEYGRIDILHNNAGIEGEVTEFGNYPVDTYDQVIAVNQRGVFLGMKYVLPVMEKQQAGSIINTSSIGGIVGGINFSAYVASKHAVVGMTRSAAIEYGAKNVRINAICPGPIATNMGKNSAEKFNPDNPQEYHDLIMSRVPSKRYGKPEEVAGLVAFLGSDEAPFINGAIIPIDGAMTAL